MNKSINLRRNLFLVAVVVVATYASSVMAQCPKPGLVLLKTVIASAERYTGRAVDLNGDGKPDLATHEYQGITKISLGLGGGDFAPASNYSTPGDVIVPDFGDLNGDGRPEMIINSVTGSFLDIWMNNGSGSFSFANSVSHPHGGLLAVADLNGDGKGDLISARPTNNFSVRLGNGAGGFGPATTYFPDTGSFFMEGAYPGDFNGDGKLDVAVNLVSRPGGLPSVNLKLFLNDGTGALIPDGGNLIGAIEIKAVGDLNGDGKDDLVGATPLAASVSIVLNRGSSTFTIETYTVRATLGTPYLGDFDGDGKLDVFVRYNSSNSYYQGRTILFGDGLGGVSSQGHVSKHSPGLVTADFNGDGKLDYLESGQNAWTRDNVINIWQSTCNAPGDPDRIDFDGEGSSEASVFRPSNGRWYRPNLLGGPALSTQFGANGDVATPGDYDGDGKTDLAVFRPSSGDWYVFNSATQTVTGLHFGAPGDRAVPADYDGDSRTDFAIYRPSSGVWFMLYSGDTSVHGVAFGIGTDIPIPADFDGDSKADVAVYRGSEGMWYMIRSGSNAFYAQPWGLPSDIPVPADYDSDGKADVTIFRPSNGFWFSLRSFNSTMIVMQLGQSGDVPLAGFVGGVNTFESPTTAVPAVYRPSNGTFYSAFSVGIPVQLGIAGDVPASTLYPVQ